VRTQKRIHKSQFQDLITNVFLIFFACQSVLGKEGTKRNFTFLYGPGATDRDRRASLVRILTLCPLWPVSPGSLLQAPE